MERATNFNVREPAFVNGLQEDVIEYEYTFGIPIPDVLVLRGRCESSLKENAGVLRNGFVQFGKHRLCRQTDQHSTAGRAQSRSRIRRTRCARPVRCSARVRRPRTATSLREHA